MTQRFEKAYNALLNAFMNDTLAKGSCHACAVGNIVADAMNVNVYVDDAGRYRCEGNNLWWADMFTTCGNKQTIITIGEDSRVKVFRKRIKELTGYTWREMAEVERTFENNTEICHRRYDYFSKKEIIEDQFNGLMAVMDVLIKLDEIKEGQQYKDSFKKKFQTV